MLNTRAASVAARVKSHRELTRLAGDARVGAHSKRMLRVVQVRWLRTMWKLLVLACVIPAGVCLLVALFAPHALVPYLIGGIVASTFWGVHFLMMITGGVASLWSGILGEYWTAQELRRLKRRGWMSVNHFMLDGSDIDHVLVGPGGFFAIETKFRSDWRSARPYLNEIGRTATHATRALRMRIDPRKDNVRGIVVMWGWNTADCELPAEFDGVSFVAGADFQDLIAALPDVVDESEVLRVFERLSAYVARRDIGEELQSGALPRSIQTAIFDLSFVVMSGLVTALVVTSSAAVYPHGLWSLLTAAALAGVSVWLRRSRPQSLRVRLITTTALTMAGTLSVLIGLVLAISAFR
jgi:hypothetical protein